MASTQMAKSAVALCSFGCLVKIILCFVQSSRIFLPLVTPSRYIFTNHLRNMKKTLLFTLLFFSLGLSQSNSNIKKTYGLKFLSFSYKYEEHFIGASLPLISGTGVSDKFTGIDIGLILSSCSKIKFYPSLKIDKNSYRVHEFKGVAISGLINSMQIASGLSITCGLTSVDQFTGVSISGLSIIEKFNGLSASWLMSFSHDATGFFFGGLVSGGLKFSGVSTSLGISGAKQFKGLSIGSVSLIDEEMIGLQIGLVNYAKALYGIQIGLINIAKNAVLPYTIGVNWNL